MKRHRVWIGVLAVAVAAIVFVGFRALRGGTGASTIDLVDRFPEAEKRTAKLSLHEAFRIEEVTIGGETRRSIFAHPPSRITWKVVVSSHSVLETAYAIRPDAWSQDGDGATFRIGVSDGSEYREFVRQRLDPYHNPSDRRWFPVTIDLGDWAGREVEIIFNTEPNFTAVHDAAVWGSPVIHHE